MIADNPALKQAVLAAPVDDLPRQVYADWLDEAGDSDRAEFIRAQLKLETEPPWEPFAVRARHHAPQWIHGLPWRSTLPKLGSGTVADWHAEKPFRRGFGWCVHVRQMGAFLEMAPEIFKHEPVGELVLPAAGRDEWESLAQAPWLTRIQKLRFTTGSGLSEPIRALAHSPYSGNIDSIAFEVSTSPGMGAVVEGLVQSKLVRQLKNLEFRLGHDREGDILQELNAARDLKLERLALSTMGQGSEALEHLSGLPNAGSLKALTIQHQTVTGAVASTIAAGLQVFPLRQFAVLAGQLTGADLIGFASRSVQALDLSENILDDIDGVLRFPNLRVLQLKSCGLDNAGLGCLTAAEFWPHLVELDLSGNRFDDAGLQHLVECVRPAELEALILKDVAVGDGTKAALIEHFGEAVIFA